MKALGSQGPACDYPRRTRLLNDFSQFTCLLQMSSVCNGFVSSAIHRKPLIFSVLTAFGGSWFCYPTELPAFSRVPTPRLPTSLYRPRGHLRSEREFHLPRTGYFQKQFACQYSGELPVAFFELSEPTRRGARRILLTPAGIDAETADIDLAVRWGFPGPPGDLLP